MMVFARTRRQVRLVGVVLAALLLIDGSATQCRAHEITPAIADMDLGADGGYQVAVRLNLEALMAGIGPAHTDTTQSENSAGYERMRALSPAQLGAEFEDFTPTFLDGVSVIDDLGRLEHEVISVRIPGVGDTGIARGSTVFIASSGRAPSGTITWSLDPRFGSNILRVTGPAGEEVYSAYLTDGGSSDPIPLSGASDQTLMEVVLNYLWIGFTHILPLGVDHILFVVGLFLLSTSLRPLVIQVTSFTIAHTITLALGFLGIVHIPPAIVEPLIAASIVYVAVENIMTDRLHKWRTAVVFCFGLLHGLGFAGVLSEIGVSTAHFVAALLSFNVGVELGQLAVIACCFVFFGPFRGRPWYRRAVVVPASALIGITGAYWFVQRVASVG